MSPRATIRISAWSRGDRRAGGNLRSSRNRPLHALAGVAEHCLENIVAFLGKYGPVVCLWQFLVQDGLNGRPDTRAALPVLEPILNENLRSLLTQAMQQ